MAKRFLTNIDVSKNEIQNVVIHKLGVAPTSPVEGQVYYNTTDSIIYLRLNAIWKNISGELDAVLAAAGFNAMSVVDNGDGTLSIDIATATQVNKGLLSTTDKTTLDNATNLATASTLVARDISGDAQFNRISASDVTITNAPVNPTDAVNKSYVDTLTASGVRIVGVLNTSTNPNYPAATAGQAWHVSVAGRIGGVAGELVEAGDLIVCVTDTAGGTEAVVGGDFIIMQSNNDYATETIAGFIRIATTVEVTAGVEDTTVVTPAKMAVYVAAQIASSGKYAVDVGNGVLTQFILTHGLNDTDVSVIIKDTTTLELVETDIKVTDVNNVTIDFNVAPANNAYRILVQG